MMATTGLAIMLYGIFRFIVEFYRVPDAQLGYLAFDWLTMGQLLSFPMIVIGGGMTVFAYKKSHEKLS
jgi:phosphatidylglycerol:prolipoprotein diacylglycerol transferase